MFNLGVLGYVLICLAITNEAFQVDVQQNLAETLKSHLKESQSDLLPRELVEELVGKFRGNLSEDQITVTINEYADKIFENLRNVILKHNLNTVVLPDTTLKLKPTGKIDLSSGLLEDLETISRSDDVILTYYPTSKIVALTLPMKFGDLKFSYKFHTKVTFISIHGGVHGTVKNIKVHAGLSFDLNNNHAALDHYDMKHTGDITVKFTGNKAIDWLTNSMTKVFTVFFNPVIVGVTQKMIRNTLRELVSQLNEIIDQILHH